MDVLIVNIVPYIILYYYTVRIVSVGRYNVQIPSYTNNAVEQK